MKKITTEFLIIGSGFGSLATALRLAEAGFKVLMVEKGKNIRGKQDFKQSQDPSYIQKYLKGFSGEYINFTYAEALGGGSGFYEMVTLRAPTIAFNQISDTGHRLWPVELNRNTFDPYYELAENMLNVTQIPADKIPKSGVVFSKLMKNLGYSCDRARYAVVNCMGSGFCVSGCIFGSKQSLHNTYIPKAKEGGLEILTDIEAREIIPVKKHGKFTYQVFCKSPDESLQINSTKLILGAGTVGTAKLLLRSRKNMPVLSKHVGKNICFNGSVKVAGMLPQDFIDGDMFSGMSHTGMISYHFLEEKGLTISSAKPLPLYLVSSHQFNIKGEDKDSFWGQANVDVMKAYRRKMVALYALGFSPQTASISKNRKGTFEAKLEMTGELIKYYHETKALMHSILERNGCSILETQRFDSSWRESDKIFFSSAHMTGSCRMAGNEDQGVVDSSCEVFNYPGLYIADGSVIPSSLAVNTSLTILANAERVAELLVSKYS